jgi:hypothetical protein
MNGVLASKGGERPITRTGDFLLPMRVCKEEWDGLFRTFPG